MSEAGRNEARRLLGFWSIRQRAIEEGRVMITVDVTGRPIEADLVDGCLPVSAVRTYEQHVAVRVSYACGWRDHFGRAHGGCGREWSEAKIEGDPDPPADTDGNHENCAKWHRIECAACRDKDAGR